MNRKLLLIAVCLVMGLAITVPAMDITYQFGANLAYYTPDHDGATAGHPGFVLPNFNPLSASGSSGWTGGTFGYPDSDGRTRKIGSTWGAAEAETFFRVNLTFPFLQGNGLFADNNLQVRITPNLTPISFHVQGEVYWTPIAFLVLKTGIQMGTGWPMPILGVDGLALRYVGNSETRSNLVSGYCGEYYLGGTFQFDLAAVVPGDYNHVVFQATAKTKYRHYSKAGADDAWVWRADSGQNFNGWVYDGSYILGWMPPWQVNFIGFLVAHNFRIGENARRSTIAGGGWGSDFHSIKFGPLANIALADDHGLIIQIQFKNGLYYTDETVYHNAFQHRDATGETYIKFERIAFAYTWNL